MSEPQASLGEFAGDGESNGNIEADRERRKYREASVPSESACSVPELGEEASDCIVFDISGDWGHFRRPHTGSPMLTYAIPPRTTIAGLIAAIQGYPRDSYYQLFLPENSRVAVGPTSATRRFTVPMNYLDTEGTKTRGAKPGRKITENRQQMAVEYLVNPSFRVFVSVDSPEFMDQLETRLREKRPHYPPSLGKAHCIASTEFVGRFEMETRSGKGVEINSTIPGENPDLVIESGPNYVSDKFPAYFDVTENGDRKPKKWHNLTFDAGGDPVTIREGEYTIVGDNHVIFE